MSLFGKKPEQPQSPTPSASSPEPSSAPKPSPSPTPAPAERAKAPAPSPSGGGSFLGNSCTFVGDLEGEGSFECGGKFNGSIDVTGDLVVAHSGVAEAELKARSINIEGRLTGNATGSAKVTVGPSGHVEGDVRAPAVQFAEGAFFEGNVEMRRSKAAQGGDSGAKDSSDKSAPGSSAD